MFFFVVSLAVGAIFIQPTATAQRIGPRSSADVMDYTESFVRATYPELSGSDLLYSATVSGAWTNQRWRYDSVAVQVNPKELAGRINSMEDLSRVLLHVVLEFDGRGFINLRTNGAHLAQARRLRLADLFASNGPSTVDRVRVQLRSAGARYVDDEDAVRARLPLQEWKALFGEVRVGQATLNAPSPLIHGADPHAGEWSMTIQVSRPAGVRYEVFLEPFEGRVVEMYRKD